MALPNSFGQFFPDGNYVGWDEELAEYFDHKMPADQKALFERPGHSSYARHVSEKFTNEPGLKRPGFPSFGPIAAHEAPKRFEAEKKYASLGSLIELNDRILAVDESLKEVIERFEPGVHHFFPIEIIMPKKIIYPKQYFVMAIGQYLNSFSSERSDPASWRPDWQEYCLMDEGNMSGLALSRQAFGNAHLWRERCISNELVCFSDQLMSEITRAGLRLPKCRKLKEV
ncbi:MAG: DUF1629 domain-containing protein [Hyphomicrobiaceae bacterium]